MKMKIYSQMEEGICRYLECSGIPWEIVVRLGVMELEASPDSHFWKESGRIARPMVLELTENDFKFLFTKSLEEGRYMGEILEDCIDSVFFRYILL